MPPKTNQTQKIPDAILLALASAGAYLFSYYYEKGYTSVFKIPSSLIVINLSSLLTFGAIIIGGFIFLIPIGNVLVMFVIGNSKSSKGSNPVFLHTLFPVIIVGILAVIQIAIFGIRNWQQWLLYAIMLLVAAFFQFAFPLLSQKGKNYAEKLSAQEETEKQFPDAFVLMRNKFGNSSLIIFLVFILGISIAENVGKSSATNQKDFLVTNTTPEMVVLRVYGDNFICAPFTRATGKTETTFTLLKSSGDANLVLNLETIGPLHPLKTVETPPQEITNTATPTIIPTSVSP
jgi:hypothetical protein